VKGQKVAVMGTLTQRIYEQNGEKKNIIEVVAREVDFGEKARGAQGSRAVSDEDIPF
jgi:single-strand binding family protein